MTDLIPLPPAAGPDPGMPGHFANHEWLAAAVQQLNSALGPLVVDDSGWLDLTLQAGYTVAGGLKPQARQIGNHVYLRGFVANSAAVTNVAHAMTLPAGIGIPGAGYSHHMPMNGNTATVLNRYFEVRADGKVWAYSAAASGAWWSFCGDYLTD